MTLNKTIFLFLLSGLIVGCGGGGGSGSNDTVATTKDEILSTEFDNTTSYKWGSIQFDTTFVEITKNSRNGNIWYADYSKLDKGTEPDIGRLMLSTDGLYKPDETKYPLGYRRYILRSTSQDGTTLRKTPYNKDGLKNIVVEEKGRWIDLTNVRISDRTAVYWNLLAEKIPTSVFFHPEPIGDQFKDFLALTKKNTFPAGAKCFQVERTNYSVPYYVITNTESLAYINGVSVNNFSDYVSLAGGNAVTGKWGNIQWAYLNTEANDPKYYTISAYMNIDNKLASGYWQKNPNTSIDSIIAGYEKSLDSFNNNDDVISFQSAIAEAKNECTYYNSVASQKIESLMNQTLLN